MDRLPFSRPGSFWRGNLHCHSDRSDGALTPAGVIAAYRDAGYQFVALTDHQTIGYHLEVTDTRLLQTPGFTTLLGVEVHPGMTSACEPWHLILIGVPADFVAVGVGESPSSVVHRAARAGAFIMLAHPQWYGLDHEDAEGLPIAHAVEVWNAAATEDKDRPDGWALVDRLASTGSMLLGCAVDDAHFRPGIADRFRGWVWVMSESLDPESLLDALKAGAFYSSTGPRIHDVRVEPAERITVTCDPVERIFLTGRGSSGGVVAGKDITTATFELDDFASPYARITIRASDGGRAWTNPFRWSGSDDRRPTCR
jgi:hypothetical protein